MPLWTGKQLLGVLLRPNRAPTVSITMTAKARVCDQKNQMDKSDGYLTQSSMCDRDDVSRTCVT
jgi:hypothetical protein